MGAIRIDVDDTCFCPTCNRKIDGATAMNNPDATPKEGSISICLYCHQVSEFKKVGEYFVLIAVHPQEIADWATKSPALSKVVNEGVEVVKAINAARSLTIPFIQKHKGGVFASGVIYSAVLDKEPVRWVCAIGEGYSDWSIYYHHEQMPVSYVLREGIKMTTESLIRKLVPCDDEVFRLYRY